MSSIDSIFNHSKSICKGLEYTLARLPIVASNYAPYSDAFRHKESALLCKNDEEWYESITQLLENSDMREEMIRNARKMAAEKFNLRKNAKKLGDVIYDLGSEFLTARSERKSHSETGQEVAQTV